LLGSEKKKKREKNRHFYVTSSGTKKFKVEKAKRSKKKFFSLSPVSEMHAKTHQVSHCFVLKHKNYMQNPCLPVSYLKSFTLLSQFGQLIF
jgi:hypothetical protein